MKFLQDNILLIAVAFVSGAMLLWPYVRRATGGPSVGPSQATQLINREDAMVIDVREPGEYGAGHILGAKNVPLSRVDTGGADGVPDAGGPFGIETRPSNQSCFVPRAEPPQGNEGLPATLSATGCFDPADVRRRPGALHEPLARDALIRQLEAAGYSRTDPVEKQIRVHPHKPLQGQTGFRDAQQLQPAENGERR